MRGVECCGEEDAEAVEEDVGDQRGRRIGREEGKARLESRPEDRCGLGSESAGKPLGILRTESQTGATRVMVLISATVPPVRFETKFSLRCL